MHYIIGIIYFYTCEGGNVDGKKYTSNPVTEFIAGLKRCMYLNT